VLLGFGGLEVLFGDYWLAAYLFVITFMAWSSDRRAHWAYRAGWFSGRAAALLSMSEAAQRGLTMEQWIDSLAEVDMALMNDKGWPGNDA
jgi:hypothetical protein